MLTSDTKNKINQCRDILVGKIPDPKGQIDQITNALIYKFMDDQDLASISLGGKASNFVDELAPYAWHILLDPKLDNQQKADLYREGLEKLAVADSLPKFFREVFKNSYLPFRDASTIAMFIKQINEFEYQNEELGNAFEYLLSIMGSQGDAGQFRTPRNIIEFVVKANSPKKTDKILDPACGTAGFLVEAFTQIQAKDDLSQFDRKNLASNIVGLDIDPGMAKIARVNLYLHGFNSPQITEDDTLTNEGLWLKEKYDLILANPPFMTPKGGIEPHNKFSVSSNRAEVLFVDYIAEHLKLEGRAGIIVPEGIIFQSGKAYKQLRKKLVDDGFLYAVVSLPAGVFQPYSGVKTSVLLLDRKIASKKDDILFIKVENDGFDLGAQRRETKDKNDLPKALEILEEYRSGDHRVPIPNDSKNDSRPNGVFSLLVPKTKIAENSDYNLSGDRYKIATDYSNAVWPMVELGEVCDILNGYSFKSEKYTDSGIRVVRITNVQKGEIVDDNPKFYSTDSSKEIEKFLLVKNDLLISLTGNVGRVGLIQSALLPAGLNQRVGCIRLTNTNKISISYLFQLLNTNLFENECIKSASGVAQKNLSTEWLKKFKIPLPPLSVQQKIVAEIEIYQNIIAGAKQVVNNWKPTIQIDPEWEKVKLGEVCEIPSRLVDPRKDVFRNMLHVGGANIISETGELVDMHSAKEEELISGKFLFDETMVLYSKIRPYLKKVSEPRFKGLCSADIYPLKPFEGKLIRGFLFSLLLTPEFTQYAIQGSGRVGMPKVNRNHLFEFLFGLPPIEVQEQIVAKIEAEKVLIDGNKKLIEIYEAKVKEAVGRVWEG